MKSGRLRRSTGAVWLGIVALVFNALVPVHLAFDLAEALAPAQWGGAPAEAHDAAWRLLALVTGHRAGDGQPCGEDHRTPCPVFHALGALAGFAPPAPVTVSLPVAIAIGTALPAGERGHPAASLAFYHSRAPPAV